MCKLEICYISVEFLNRISVPMGDVVSTGIHFSFSHLIFWLYPASSVAFFYAIEK